MPKTVHRSAFEAASRYWREIAQGNWTAGQPSSQHHSWAAIYLCGYSIECGFKVMICRHHGDAQTISEAMERIGSSCPDFLSGGVGHHLRTMSGYTGVHEAMFRELGPQAVSLALDRWDVAWRYGLPPGLRALADRDIMWRALDTVSDWVVRKL